MSHEGTDRKYNNEWVVQVVPTSSLSDCVLCNPQGINTDIKWCDVPANQFEL